MSTLFDSVANQSACCRLFTSDNFVMIHVYIVCIYCEVLTICKGRNKLDLFLSHVFHLPLLSVQPHACNTEHAKCCYTASIASLLLFSVKAKVQSNVI